MSEFLPALEDDPASDPDPEFEGMCWEEIVMALDAIQRYHDDQQWAYEQEMERQWYEENQGWYKDF